MPDKLPNLPADRYHELRFVGCGSEGRVWRAFDSEIGQPVAIKEYSSTAGRSFYQEIRVYMALTHESMLKLHDFYDFGERKYIVWEFCSGGTLRSALDSPISWPIDRVLSLARQLSSALGTIHRAGVVHGDLKPENILRKRHTGAECWKLGDFGISTFTATGRAHRFGTAAYIAPEVPAGKRCAASDIWALGKTLGECIPKLGTAISHPEATAMEEVSELVKSMCRENPELRPTAAEIHSVMRRLETGVAISRHDSSGEVPIPIAGSLGLLEAWSEGGAA